MKIGISVKRKILQFISFALSDPYIGNFYSGKLYKGFWKNFCNPGLNCYSCPAAGLSCPIGAMQAVNGSIDFKLSFYVLGTLCAFGILLGRAVCGFLCPFGLLQELLYKIPSPKKKIRKEFRYIKYVMLFLVVGMMPVLITNAMGMGDPFFCKYICPAGTLEGGIPMLLAHAEISDMAGWLLALKLLIAACTVVGCILVMRLFCKVLCPLGAFYGFFNKISFIQLETDQNACVSCGKCAKVCPMDVDPSADPNSMECIRCGKCVSVCDQQAISIRKLAAAQQKRELKQSAEN